MEKYIENHSRETRYYDLSGHKFVDDSSIYVAERVGFEQWSRNFLDEVLNFGENKEIVGVCNLIPVPARTRWEVVNHGLRFICVFGLYDVPK